jgi:3'(2'), 5'-bisphosphate nucleotidase
MRPTFEDLLEIAEGAGTLVMKHYKSVDQEIELKEDDSPVTIADRLSHGYIVKSLQERFSIPIISEEHPIAYEDRKNWGKYFLVDPLDGTKDFIDQNDEFSICIAYLEDNRPVIGLIYAPAIRCVYYAEKGKGLIFMKNGFRVQPHVKNSKELRVVCSRHHHNPEMEAFIQANKIESTFRVGSAIKFGALAMGQANLYPRFTGSKEWDIAAGHVLLDEAGFKFIDLQTGNTPQYNKPSMKNNFFIAFDDSLDISQFASIARQGVHS